MASDEGDMQAQAHSHDVIPLRAATRAWSAISLQTFGGPAGQIAVMQRTLVDEKRWIGQQRFLFALCCCTLLPGVRGALVAGILFILLGAPDVEVPELASIQWAALAISALGLALVFWRRWSVLRTLGACALAGIVVGLAGAI